MYHVSNKNVFSWLFLSLGTYRLDAEKEWEKESKKERVEKKCEHK